MRNSRSTESKEEEIESSRHRPWRFPRHAGHGRRPIDCRLRGTRLGSRTGAQRRAAVVRGNIWATPGEAGRLDAFMRWASLRLLWPGRCAHGARTLYKQEI